MKIFISMPMKGKTEEQIRKELEDIKSRLLEKYPDAEFIDSLITEELDEKHPGLLYLAESIKRLDQADAIYMAEGWSFARGCIIEFTTSRHYDIERIFLEF